MAGSRLVRLEGVIAAHVDGFLGLNYITGTMSNSENVTGPGKGFIGVVAVLLLTVGTWLGLWGMHKRWYVHPMNPIAPVESNAGPN
jgi:hypothetical protein